MSINQPDRIKILVFMYREEKLGRVYHAIHEFEIPAVSQNTLGTRLPEMRKAGLVDCRRREGARFKEWRPTEAGVKLAEEFVVREDA
jgi:DNA-binding HxlR family transcriptional regulator